jgi:hypothetical protein
MTATIDNLKGVSMAHSNHTERFAGKSHAQLRFYRIEGIPGKSLDDYLMTLLASINAFSKPISTDSLFPREV